MRKLQLGRSSAVKLGRSSASGDTIALDGGMSTQADGELSLYSTAAASATAERGASSSGGAGDNRCKRRNLQGECQTRHDLGRSYRGLRRVSRGGVRCVNWHQ